MLTQSIERYAEEFHCSPVPASITAVPEEQSDVQVTAVNPAAARLLDTWLDYVLGQAPTNSGWHAIREDGSDYPQAEFPTVISLGDGVPMLGKVMGLVNTWSHEEHWVEIDSVPVFNAGDDKPQQVCTTFIDITERKRADKALSDLARKLTSASRAESLVSNFFSHLARIFGGGLRTSW